MTRIQESPVRVEGDELMPSQGSERLTITVAEAAIQLGISKGNCYEAIRQGSIPALRLGRRIVIPKVALQRLLVGEGMSTNDKSSEV